MSSLLDHMPGLIQELVNDASDAAKPVSQLLRRMKVAAVRLKLKAPSRRHQ